MGDCVWMKTPNGCCTSPYTCGHITGVISPLNILVIDLNTSESGSDSELSTQSAKMIINEVCSDPLEVNNMYAMDDTSADELSKEEVPLPQRSARCKRPTPVCHLCDHEIAGGCSEIERQNLQTTASDEPTGVRRSKRQ